MRGSKYLSGLTVTLGLITPLLSGCGAAGESAQVDFEKDLKAMGFAVLADSPQAFGPADVELVAVTASSSTKPATTKASSGSSSSPSPKKSDGPTAKPSKSKSNTLEVIANVLGCDVEFERPAKGARFVRSVGDRQIEEYTADEINVSGSEIEFKLPGAPDLTTVMDQLKARKLPCLDIS